MPTRDRFVTRLEELRFQLEQLKEQFSITRGAIADIEYWIKEDDKPAEAASVTESATELVTEKE
jgi:hypothetical protein